MLGAILLVSISTLLFNRALSLILIMWEFACQVGITEALTLALFWTAALFPVQRYDSKCPENLLSASLANVSILMDACLREAMSATTAVPEVVVSGMVLEKVVRLSTESMAWFGLCLQSWTAGLQSGSKKKKHPQSVPNSSENIVGALQKAIHSLCSQMETCSSWATTCLVKFKDKKHQVLLNTDSASSMGHILRTLTTGLEKENSRPKLWDTLLKDIADCQQATTVGIRDTCNSRLRVLKSLKF